MKRILLVLGLCHTSNLNAGFHCIYPADHFQNALNAYVRFDNRHNHSLASRLVSQMTKIDNPNFFYANGFNALHLALIKKHDALIRSAIENGMDINQAIKKQHNPRIGYKVKLFQKKAHMLETLSPLHIAILNMDLKSAKYLVKNGAMLEPRNFRGETPFDMVSELCSEEPYVHMAKPCNGFYRLFHRTRPMLFLRMMDFAEDYDADVDY